jgi:prolyl-tRNA synthetase
MGLQSIPMVAESGPIGGSLSHEFIVLADTGESEVFCHRDYLDMPVPSESVNFDDPGSLQTIVDRWTTLYAATSDKHEPAAFAVLATDKQVSARGIEVGHIFYFGTKYSEPMKALVMGPDGREQPVQMGSYGIGPSRLVAAIIEASHDENGIIWPKAVAPFQVVILNLKQGDTNTDRVSNEIYEGLIRNGIDALYDDRDERPGSKFAVADLVGIPLKVLVGPRGLAEGTIEVRRRSDGKSRTVPSAEGAKTVAEVLEDKLTK